MQSGVQELRAAIADSVQNHAFPNAVFLAERLCSESKSEENIAILANAYISNSQYAAAFALTKSRSSSQNRYLFALASFKLNKLQEAERALLSEDRQVPNGAFGWHLLGEICKKANRPQQAIQYFRQCIVNNPLIWTAYENLCQLGQDVDANQYFGVDTLHRIVELRKEHTLAPSHSLSSSNNTSADSLNFRQNVSQNTSFTPLVPKPPATFELHSTPNNNTSSTPPLDSTPMEGGRRGGGAYGSSTAFSGAYGGSTAFVSGTYVTPSPPDMLDTPPHVLPGFKAPRDRHKAQKTYTEQRIVGSNAAAPRKRQDNLTKKLQEATSSDLTASFSPSGILVAASPDIASGMAEVFDLLAIFGNAYRHRCMYRCHECIREVERLPSCHRHTAWAYSEIGRAYFDIGDYHKSEAAFRASRQLEPHRLQGLEIYSTVLWFLKREHQLSALAQEMAAMDRHAAETWCVLGNCFSLQREFETALKFFQRAVQLEPTFAYAYTLAGHEHVSNEDFDKALTSFRAAIRCDNRHYNAWYGLGTIYLKQEKFDLAEYHFQRASMYNQQNAVLLCSMGMAVLGNNGAGKALAVLASALALDPANPLVKLKMAMALMQLGRLQESLEQLQSLQQIAPRESTVYFQMGKIYKAMGNTQAALMNFTHALDLDPRNSNMVKAAIDKLHSTEAMDDDTL